MSGLSGFPGCRWARPSTLPNGEDASRLNATAPVCVMPVGPAHDGAAHDLVDDLLAAGLRPRLETHASLGSRIHTSRQRRDCLIAVLGQAEIDAHQVHVTDIAAGSTSPVARDRLIQTLQHSHRKRTATPNWAIPD